MSKSFFNKNYCPKCKQEKIGGFLGLAFLGDIYSWTCPHCGALIRLNWLLLVIYQLIGLGLFVIFILPIVKFTELFSSNFGLAALIFIMTILLGIFPLYATPRKFIRDKENPYKD